VEGPWENSPYNPMVRTRSQEEKWWRQGHGTLIDDVAGNWWFFYTGFENGYTLFGKQILLLPVEWTPDGWPRVKAGVTPTDIIAMPAGENVGHGMALSDDFASSALGIQWQYAPQTNPAEAFRMGDGKLTMRAKGKTLSQSAVSLADANWLGVMPVNHSYEAEVEITISDKAEGGMMLSGGRGGASSASLGLRSGEAFGPAGPAEFVKWSGNRIFVRLRNIKYDVQCFYSTDGRTWTPFDHSVSVTNGINLALYAGGEGEVTFRNFKYRGLD